MDTRELLRSLTSSELAFIAGQDYGVEAARHLQALEALIADEALVLTQEHNWYPYEVVQLGAHALVAGHEREFAACTVIVLHAVAYRYDTATFLDSKLDDRSQDYDRLAVALREMVLASYLQAGANNSFKPDPLRGSA